VELSNLQRQVLHGTPDVGRPKVESAAGRLEALNPEVEVEPVAARLDSENALEIFRRYDVVVDGSDNFPTRYLVNDAGVLTGTPTVYGAIHRFHGQAAVFGLEDGPCYRCLFREPPPPETVPSCAEAGVLGVLPGIIGSVQAAEAIKLLAGIGTPLSGRLLLLDALEMRFREIEVRRDPACPVCGEDPEVTGLIDYERFCGVAGDEAAEREGSPEEEASVIARTSADGVPQMEVQELKRRLDAGEELAIVDVREPHEWRICNLEEHGAELVPMARVPERVDDLPRDRPLVVHCRTGPRSHRAVEYLRSRGYENAVNLAGGIRAWAEEIDEEMPTY
jgi:adenylyltransferase/sulfurtransferase